VVLHVVLRVVRRNFVPEVVAEIVLRLVQPGVQALVQRVVLIALEAETERVVDGIVQPVEPLVQPVVTEVVAEMTDLDMTAECRRRAGLRAVAQGVEQPVLGAGLVTQLLVPEAHRVTFRLLSAEPKSMVVPVVFRIVHSHDVHGPPDEPLCPGLQRHCLATEFPKVTIFTGNRPAASMGSWNR
jgi:hypothetical protein